MLCLGSSQRKLQALLCHLEKLLACEPTRHIKNRKCLRNAMTTYEKCNVMCEKNYTKRYPNSIDGIKTKGYYLWNQVASYQVAAFWSLRLGSFWSLLKFSVVSL
jgi:hypothetical protein